MIMFFRNLTETWVAKLLLLLIALSMGGLFGLGQMTSYWGAKTDAIRVGDVAVKPQELLRDVERQAREMTVSNFRYVSVQEALKAGVLPVIVANKINTILSKTAIDDLGLIASQDAVGKYIVNRPEFQTITGAYDDTKVQSYMDMHQMSEQEFITAMREELAKKHLTDAFDAVVRMPKTEQDAIYAYINARRDFETILLPASAVEVEEKPTEETLKNYYDAMTENLYTPEYRQIRILRLTPKAIAETLPVSDEQIKAVYDERKDVYSTPEKRKVEQIWVKDKEAAQALYATLTPDNFAQVESIENQQEYYDFGWITKDVEIGESAFSAEVGKVMPPFEGQSGFHILIVRDVEEAKQTPFDEVKDDIKSALQAEQAYDILVEKSKMLDNALGEGQTLATAAKLISFKPEDAVWIDISGVKNDGTTTLDLPKELTDKVFSMRAGDVSPLYDYENGYIVAELVDVKESVLRPFDEVKDEVIAEWKKDIQNSKAADFAQKILDESKKAQKLEDVANAHNLEFKPLAEFNRNSLIGVGIGAKDVETLFNGKEGDIILISAGQNDYVLVKVTQIISSDEEDVVAKELFSKVLAGQFTSSMYEELLSYYKQKNKVEVNDALIKETFAQYMGSTN